MRTIFLKSENRNKKTNLAVDVEQILKLLYVEVDQILKPHNIRMKKIKFDNLFKDTT